MDKVDKKSRYANQPRKKLAMKCVIVTEPMCLYQIESVERIHYVLLLKEQLMDELILWIQHTQLTQSAAAKILHVTRPRVSDVVNKKTHKFTLDALVNMLFYIGKPLKIMSV